MMWKVEFHRSAVKDLALLKQAGLAGKARTLAKILEHDPFQTPPFYEKLSGDLYGKYSRRINIQHRMVYEVNEATRTVRVLRMWSHYGDN
ncbi:MAG: Txe/YoeB family addiction module toxin [Clostridia bacterium]|nr:Txe/YoeB family addiction module toxin [Clostridia bacterium]